MFAPNILVVENKRVVLGEVCRNLSVAFAEVHPPFIFFCPVFILLSSFSLLFSLSFFLLHALFSPFHPSRSLWAHICAHPLACAPPPLCKPPAPCPSNNIRCTAPACPLFCQTIRKLRIKSSFFPAKVWRESQKAIPLHSLFRNTATVTHWEARKKEFFEQIYITEK